MAITLFRALLRAAPQCPTEEALQKVAEAINAGYQPPFCPAELQEPVRSAWRYQQAGANWVGKEARAVVTRSEHERVAAHRHGADALLLLTKLRFEHGTGREFCLAAKAMAQAQIFPRWGRQRYRNAITALLETGRLRVVYRGGRRAGDASRYAFADEPVRAT